MDISIVMPTLNEELLIAETPSTDREPGRGIETPPDVIEPVGGSARSTIDGTVNDPSDVFAVQVKVVNTNVVLAPEPPVWTKLEPVIWT